MNKIKNAYLYAYYECYLQTHIYYKTHKNKNFYSSATLGFVLFLLLVFPLVIFLGNKFEIGKWMYLILIGVAYGHLYFDSWLIGDDDLTEKINAFYANKKTVKESRNIVLIFVFLCIMFWIFAIKYDYY
ncbi:hypothetical protein C1637_07510 [Chryseobacterium lactis]|uniref:Uncharacterized protein n=1 Tax=Chryseobacterium lactis TaxID=1241981 RepID=A0A3G6RJQ3_CHRLC|nr:hypothetical protein [Chryseobacterium lactis]AZA84676.1 hypothetical protein EG342_23480 [Chryseobacterium lactis]AZB05065.1 hypothetical protein EG341_14360 [Chryseobacterium lactis]PNW14796.1 hypothetical protein C1637_07510 [Chryseobacterium lactis]